MSEVMRRPNVEITELGSGLVALTGSLKEIGYALKWARRAGTVAGEPTPPMPTGVPGEVMVTVRRAAAQRPKEQPRQPAMSSEVTVNARATGGRVVEVFVRVRG
jgi:hypothetical protein